MAPPRKPERTGKDDIIIEKLTKVSAYIADRNAGARCPSHPDSSGAVDASARWKWKGGGRLRKRSPPFSRIRRSESERRTETG